MVFPGGEALAHERGTLVLNRQKNGNASIVFEATRCKTALQILFGFVETFFRICRNPTNPFQTRFGDIVPHPSQLLKG